MTMLDKLRDPGTWNDFYEYKTHLACPKAFARQLRAFTDTEGYLPVCEAIARGEGFPLPRRSVISKLSSQKKRTVYTYPDAENTVLKLLTYLLLRKYDGLFSDGLYSFRPGRSAKDAIRRLIKVPGIGSMWSYKVDIHDYFNSVGKGTIINPIDIEDIDLTDTKKYISSWSAPVIDIDKLLSTCPLC
jgi:hypothetical protein